MANKKLRKKDVGSFSVKYLKYLFLKERKDHIPELEEDFRKRRYEEDEFDEKGNVIVEPERPPKNTNFSNLTSYVSNNIEEEDLSISPKSRIQKYINQVRDQIDKYDAEGEENFNEELQVISEPVLGDYSNRNSRRYSRNNESFTVKRDFYNHDIDSTDIDDFVSQNTAKKSSSGVRRSRKSRSREDTKEDFNFNDDNLESFDLDGIIDEKYLSLLNNSDDDFFEKEPSNSNKSTTDDIDDFLNNI